MRFLATASVPLLLLAACGGGEPERPPAGPPQVTVMTVRTEPATLTTVLPGRTSAYETSEVRPQVNGLVQARLFEEGQMVRAGQPLYRIDAAPYEAAAASARAALSRARSAIASTNALQRRYGELVKINAIARQEYDNSRTGAQQAQADVAAQQAALRSAQIDLARTTIRAPISGRIGRSVFTTGALVSAAQTDALTTIQKLDPIYVDISQSSADLLRLRQQVMAGEIARGGRAARVQLRLEDGSVYPVQGTLKFADVSVDPATGTQTIRAQFANPRGLLLPGMFVRAELIEGTQTDAILVPQRAVSRDERGHPTVLVVGADSKIAKRVIVAPRTAGDSWIVTSGLKPGERVVMEGAGQLMPGTLVATKPFGQKRAAAPASAQGSAPPPAQAQGK